MSQICPAPRSTFWKMKSSRSVWVSTALMDGRLSNWKGDSGGSPVVTDHCIDCVLPFR
jgi:hypothetical protein